VFLLLAQLCRIPQGRGTILDLNMLPRLVERFHSVSALPKVDARCRAFIALLFGRLANTHKIGCQPPNDFLYQSAVVPVLIRMLAPSKDPLCPFRYAAACCLADLAEDLLLFVPQIMTCKILPYLREILAEFQKDVKDTRDAPTGLTLTLEPLLRAALRILKSIMEYPTSRYHKQVLDCGFREKLMVISSDWKLEMSKIGYGIASLGDVCRDILSEVGKDDKRPSDKRPSAGTQSQSPHETKAAVETSSRHGAPSPSDHNDGRGMRGEQQQGRQYSDITLIGNQAQGEDIVPIYSSDMGFLRQSHDGSKKKPERGRVGSREQVRYRLQTTIITIITITAAEHQVLLRGGRSRLGTFG
jgi:hypothetical protein